MRVGAAHALARLEVFSGGPRERAVAGAGGLFSVLLDKGSVSGALLSPHLEHASRCHDEVIVLGHLLLGDGNNDLFRGRLPVRYDLQALAKITLLVLLGKDRVVATCFNTSFAGR